jgi:hypothetical protein
VTVDLWVERVSLGPPAPTARDDFGIFVEGPPVSLPASANVEAGLFTEDFMAGTSVRAEAMLDAFDADKGPALYFLHLMLPHQPWVRHPNGELYTLVDPGASSLHPDDQSMRWSWSDWIAAVSEQRHLLQAQYADALVGALLDGLQDQGLYDDSLVVVTADHGISFEPGRDDRFVSPSTIDAIAYAPLLIKAPGQRDGVVDDANVMSVDLLPTIADLLDLPVGWDVDGAPADSTAVAERGGEKLIYDMVGFAEVTLEGILRWQDADEFPSASDRWVGPLPDRDHPLSELNARLDAGHLLGRRLGDLPTRAGGEAQIDDLDRLRHPEPDRIPLGLVTGRVPGAPDDAEVLIAVDGVVVGGSKLSTDSEGRDGLIAVLLPQGVLDTDNELRAALVVDGELRELELIAG